MPRSRTSRALRAALTAVAVATATAGVPALASAVPAPPPDAGPVFPPQHTFDTPVIDGNFAEWSGDALLGPVSEDMGQGTERADISVLYDCRTGRVNIRVSGREGAVFAGDRSAHGLTFTPAGAKEPITVTGASKQAEFAFAPDLTGWEMSLPMPEGMNTGVAFANLDGGQQSIRIEASGTLDVACPTLQLGKSAEGREERVYDWAVAKTAQIPETIDPASTAVPVDYSIRVTRFLAREGRRVVVGTISATNAGEIAVPDVILRERGTNIASECRLLTADNGGAVAVPEGATDVNVGTVAPGATARATYECVVDDKAKLAKKKDGYDGENYARVQWPGPGDGNEARTWAKFSFAPYAVRASVTLVDQFQAEPQIRTEGIDSSRTIVSPRDLEIPAELGTCVVYRNSATLEDVDDPDFGPASTVDTEVCRTDDGSVTVNSEEVLNTSPVVPASTTPSRPVGLRAFIKGPATVARGQRVRYRVRVANRAKHAGRRVAVRITVPRGMRIVRVLRAPKRHVVRGRTARMTFGGIGVKRAKSVVVIARASKGARLGNRRIVVRAKARNHRAYRAARATKRVRFVRGL